MNRKEKHFELVSLEGRTGDYRAVMYNRLGGYYKEVNFLWYRKKEIYSILRNEYGCIVSRKAMNR